MSRLAARVARLEERRGSRQESEIAAVLVCFTSPRGPYVLEATRWWPQTSFTTEDEVQAFLDERADQVRVVQSIWLHLDEDIPSP